MANQFDTLQAPAQAPSGLQQAGLALQGFGAGFRGGGTQFLQGIETRKQNRQKLGLERKKAFAQDLLGTKQLLDAGDVQGASQLLGNRIGMINQLGGDPNDSMQLLQSIQSIRTPGELQSISGELGTLVNRSVAAGFLDIPKPVAGTSLERNLEAAGLTPGTPEFQEAILRSINKPTTSISIGDKGISKEQEELAKGRVGQLTTFREQRETAIDTNQSLDVLENIDVQTGALEPAKQGIAAFGKAFGIDTSNLANVAAGEGFNAEAQRIVLAVKASQKGPQTDKDEKTIRETVASLGNTKEGNQFIIDSARALNVRRIGRADFFDEFLEQNETLKGANREWSKFKRDTPMVSPVMRTPQGLPVFFFKFDQAVRSANPDATRPEILEAWRKANKRGGK